MALKKDEQVFLDLVRSLKNTNPLELRELKGIMIGLKISNERKSNILTVKQN